MRRPVRNVLLFPGGTEIGLEAYNSLKGCKEVRLFSVSDAAANHSSFVLEHHDVIPRVDHPGFFPALKAVIKAWAIDYIFAGNDIILDALLPIREQLGAHLVVSPTATCEVLRSKTRTYELLASRLRVPRIYASPADVDHFPVFVKPDDGYGAQGAIRADTPAMLAAVLPETRKPIICEYLPGREHTVDCFSHRQRGVLFCSGRERQRIRMGTSMRATISPPDLNAAFRAMADTIAAQLDLRGAWYFQVKENAAGELVLMEISPRLAGTMALHRVTGVNFALLSIYEHEDVPIDIMPLDLAGLSIDRALHNRYTRHPALRCRTIYVDLDDTIIVHGALNLDVVRFLYQGVNAGCRIVLLSKALSKQPEQILRRWRIFDLFDEIHWLAESDVKAHYIDEPEGAIFIDDSFSQRKEVAELHGIPTLDPSMIEVLFDDRV